MKNVEYIEFENGKVLKIGDKIIPKSKDFFRKVYGGAYGGGAYNSRPEVEYKFNNRLGKENEIVEIIHQESFGQRVNNKYSYLNFLLVLKTKTSRINMTISLDDCCIDEYLNKS